MKRFLDRIPLLLAGLATTLVQAGSFFPAGMDYDPDVPSPADYFGYEIGERHLTHAELVAYMRVLEETSERVRILPYGETHGQRPLMQLLISSPENLENAESLRERHLMLSDPGKSGRLDLEEMPLVVNFNYGVHGNEPSASNTAPLLAYHLAAGRGEAIETQLDELMILLDPCLNPDGFDRFAHWVRNHVGKNPNPDPQTVEHREDWPGSRTNYYFFDLNRDWMLLTQPESKGRLALFHEWMPNFVLDFHEMGTDSTYFFQPGVPERTHPLIPPRIYAFTEKISGYFAEALEETGTLYFSRERFDDFYMGKGSTISDLKGAVGILFEQASARGQVQESVNGPLDFKTAIRNQWTISLSVLRASTALREEFLASMRTFFRESLREGAGASFAGYRFASPGDPARAREFARILETHQIEVEPLSGEAAWYVPLEQPHYRYLQALVEKRTEFEQDIFYDITAWTLPLAYNLEWEELPAPPRSASSGAPSRGLERSELGYLVDWSQLNAPRLLLDLLEAEIRVKAARQPFTADGHAYTYGSLFVPVTLQPEASGTIYELLKLASGQLDVGVRPVRTFLTEEGIDLGSGQFRNVTRPKILLVGGRGVDAYEMGSIWHLLDVYHDYPVTVIRPAELSSIRLSDYTALILPDAGGSSYPEEATERLERWVKAGGSLISLGRSSKWVIDRGLVDLALVGAAPAEEEGTEGPDEGGPIERRPFDQASDDQALERIRGAIFKTTIDRSHPLAWGYRNPELPVFVEGESFLRPSANPYQTPLAFTAEPLLAGYASVKNLERMAGAAAAVVETDGRGAYILFGHTPTFRAYWRGTEKLLLNALLFGEYMQAGRTGGY